MEKATEAKNVKQIINGCGNLAFLDHEICNFSSSAAFEFRGAKMTDVRNKNRAKQSKTNSCYLWCGSKSGEKTPSFKKWKMLSNQEINSVGLIHEALVLLLQQPLVSEEMATETTSTSCNHKHQCSVS